VWYESGIQPWINRSCNVLWTDGGRSTYWTLWWHVGWLVHEGIVFKTSCVKRKHFCLKKWAVIYDVVVGDKWPPGTGGEDRFALHLAQQSQQPIRKPEEGVQRNLLARRADSVFPICFSSQGMHNCSEMLRWTVEASEGKTWEGRWVFQQACRYHGYMDWSLGRTKPFWPTKIWCIAQWLCQVTSSSSSLGFFFSLFTQQIKFHRCHIFFLTFSSSVSNVASY